MSTTSLIPTGSSMGPVEQPSFLGPDRGGASEPKVVESEPAAKVSLSPQAVQALEKATKRDQVPGSLQPSPSEPGPAPNSQRPPESEPSHRERVARAERTGEIPVQISEQEKRAKAERTGTGQTPPDGPRKENLAKALDLSPEEKQVVRELQSRDAEVRGHEQAHVAASGGMASAPSYSYQEGPDGKRYAVGGSVGIDVSPGSTPEETIKRAQVIRRAALAPAQPSGQDRAVASAASQMESQALQEQSMERAEKAKKVANGENPEEPDKPGDAIGIRDSGDRDVEKGYGGQRVTGQKGHSHLKTGCSFCGAAIERYQASGA